MRIYKKGKESFLEEFIGRVSPQGLSKLSYYFEYIASGSVGILASWVQSGMKETPEEMHAITQEFILRTPLPRLGDYRLKLKISINSSLFAVWSMS